MILFCHLNIKRIVSVLAGHVSQARISCLSADPCLPIRIQHLSLYT